MKLNKTTLIFVGHLFTLLLIQGCYLSRRIQPHSTQYFDTSIWKLDTIYEIDKRNTKFIYKQGEDSIVVQSYKKRIEKLTIFNNREKMNFVFLYYSNGRLKRSIINDSTGIKSDKHYYNDEFVSLSESYHYENGELNGCSFIYFPQAYFDEMPRVWFKSSYMNGLLHGESIWYNKNGRIIEKNLFHNGVFERTIKYNRKGIARP